MNKFLLFVLIITVFSIIRCEPTPEPTISDCKDYAEILLQKECLLINDIWGRDAGVVHVTDYRQCIFNTLSNDKISCGWNWRWTNPIGSSWVKAYPEILFGKNPYNERASTTSKLPAKISSIDKIEVSYKAIMKLTGSNNTYNLCFDLWITDSPNPNENNIKTEVMVWELGNFTPWPDYLPAHHSVTVDGLPYELYSFYHSSFKFQYRAFLPKFTPDLTNRLIRLEPFINYLKAEGEIMDEQFLSNVTFGNEIVEGSGETTIIDYSLTINNPNTFNLSGKWEGILTQPGYYTGCEVFNFSMELLQDGENVNGTSKIEVPNTLYYGLMNLSGTYKDQELSFTESSITNQNCNPTYGTCGWAWCIKTGDLLFKEDGDSLSGNWSAPGQNCLPGQVKIHKIS